MKKILLGLAFLSAQADYLDNYASDFKDARRYALLGGIFAGLFLVDSFKESIYMQAGVYGASKFEAFQINSFESYAVFSKRLPVARFDEDKYIKECMISFNLGMVAGYGLKSAALRLLKKIKAPERRVNSDNLG